MNSEPVNTYSLFISLIISGLILLGGVILIPDLNMRQILGKLLQPLTRLMLFITIGLLIGQIIEASGWTKTLAVKAWQGFAACLDPGSG